MTTFDADVQCAILKAIESKANRTAAALERVVALQERILCNKEHAARSRRKEHEMRAKKDKKISLRIRFNHTRFGGDLVKAIKTWAWETQRVDLDYDAKCDGEDPDDFETLANYWAYDQLKDFIEWLFERHYDTRLVDMNKLVAKGAGDGK